jgi:hypothetical protein
VDNSGLSGDGEAFFQASRTAAGQAIRSRPDNAAARSVRASVLPPEGAFEKGWRDYEWRLMIDRVARALARVAS